MANKRKIFKYNDEREEHAARIFSERLRKLNTEKNITVNRLTDLTSLDQSNFNKVLNIQARIHIRDIIACADFFNVSVDWLLGRTDAKLVTGMPESAQCTTSNIQPKTIKNNNNYSKEEIIAFIFYLLKSDKTKAVPISINEKIVYEYQGKDKDGTNWWYPRENKDVDYQALYFPRFWNPETHEDPEFAEKVAEQYGNTISDMEELNTMIEKFNKYLPGYKCGDIPENELKTIVMNPKKNLSH